MGKGYYRELITLLKQEAGAHYDANAKGSHERWITKHGTPLLVPRNCHSPHTANQILKEAGLKKRF
jgi:predicted RNA binding protein YcfA (HicA-like mRNA interferase family)